MKIKTRATVQFFITAAIAVLLFAVLKHTVPAIIVGTISVIVLISGLFFPSVFLKIEKFGKLLGTWVGTGITWLLLVPLFYIVFALGRLILVITKKDPLDRKFPSLAKTCWTEKKPRANPKESYRRLFWLFSHRWNTDRYENFDRIDKIYKKIINLCNSWLNFFLNPFNRHFLLFVEDPTYTKVTAGKPQRHPPRRIFNRDTEKNFCFNTCPVFNGKRSWGIFNNSGAFLCRL